MKKIIIILLLLIGFGATAQEFKTTDSLVIQLKSGNALTAIVTQNKALKMPLPAILRYSIYPSIASDKFFNSVACARGYVGVTVYVRGKYLSRQQADPFVHDAQDAWEMIDWVSKQPWCNGKVGMYGASYLGFSQWASVKSLHPALKTIVPQSAVGIGVDFPAHNNINLGYSLKWIHYTTDSKLLDNKTISEFSDQKKWNAVFNTLFTSGKSFASLDTLEGRPNGKFQEWLQHPAYDGYWKKLTPTPREYAKLNIPILTIAGYFDVDQSGALDYLKKHYHNNKNAEHYLVLGPYDHLGLQNMTMSPTVGGYKLDSVAIFKIYKLTFDWFDYVLKGGQKPALLKDRINYEVMGANQWQHAPGLEKMGTKKISFFLNADQGKAPYQLNTTINSNSNPIVQTIDFKDRADTVSGNINPLILDSTINVGKNNLVFESDTFKEQVSIAGTLEGELKAIINKKDVDISFQLYEKMSNGTYLQLYNDMLRASYSKDHSKRQLIIPGKATSIRLTNNTFFVSRKISKGSKLIFVLGVPFESGIEINYGSGKAVSQETIADARQAMIINWLPKSFLTLNVL
ncbi:CocE/NonD family hydrolase [Agrobacterium tumefaciens]|nr:CocE/NonD family hydrolase [Agrobacterium tumefaciens]NTE21001.1 CocE/NonD family hydrolase [Agrobacterium tumefaciens]